MKRILVSLLALAICAAAFPLFFASAQEGGPRRPAARPEKSLDQLVRRHERLKLDPAAAARRVRAGGGLTLATPDHKFELELTPNDMRARGYRAEATDEFGVRRALESAPVRTYKGGVRGQAEALARFTVDEETIEGMILTPEERYYVEPLGKYEPGAAATDFVLYKKSDIIEDPDEKCGVTMDGEIGDALKGVVSQLAVTAPRPSAAVGMLYEAEIATEADYAYVTALGGTAAAANTEILSTMNQVDGVYEAEAGISFKVVYQHAWEGKPTDTYPYGTDVGPTLLQRFTDHWNANFANVHRDLAHLWTGQNLVDPNRDPNLVGIAQPGTVCSNPQFAYAVSERMTSAAYRAVLAAHEIGHNFGATHNCTGTIMNSVISGSKLTFCQYSRDQIGVFLDLSGSCLTQSCNPAVSPAAQTFTAAGGAGSVTVATGASCAWTAKSNAPWIVVNSGASGSGTKTVGYTVAANPDVTARTGTLTVAGKTHTVTQGPRMGVQSLTLNPSNVAGGNKVVGKVVLSLPAPAEGAVVTLADNLAATTVRPSITIAAGRNYGTFSITTVVTAAAQTGTVTASHNGSTAAAPLTVRPAVLSSLKLSAADIMGTQDVTATVSLDGRAPAGGAVVTLSDTLTAAATPASVTIPANATTQTFVIPTAYVTARQAGSVTAKYAGASLSAPLAVRPVSVSAVVLAPASVTGGTAIQGKVLLEAPAPRTTTVTLTENAAAASVPASITIPAGGTTGAFTLSTVSVSAMQDGVVTAAAPGGSRSLPFTVERKLVQCGTLGFGAAKYFPALTGYPALLLTADFNHDHKLDVVAVSGGGFGVYLGSGAGDFTPLKQVSVSSGINDLAVGDFNQDGNRDLVFVYPYGKTAVLLGDGKGDFGSPVNYVLPETFDMKSVVVADVNGDGKQDAVVANYTTNLYVLPGDGLGGFGKFYPHRVSGYPTTEVAAGEFNGDGHTDLVRSSSWDLSLLLSDGAGSFGPTQFPYFTNSPNYFAPDQVAVGDFNTDGKQDTVVSGYQGYLYTFLGDGLGGMSPQNYYAGAGDYLRELLVTDMNGDRNEDFVALSTNNTVSIYRGDGAGKFAAPFSPAALNGTTRDVVVGDFNRDGKPDLAASNGSAGTFSVMLSTCR